METSSVNSKRPPTASKPKIDPLQLLKCLSILLNANGGIRGETEVPRVKGLMSKYSKKLVSKCIYLNILQATDFTLLDAFYDEGGWELVGTWLQEAVKASNWPLSLQVLSLLETSPMTVARLKRYATPRLVKELSRECVNTDVQNMAKQIVLKWMEVVIQGDGSGTIAGVGLSGGSSADSPLPVIDTSDSKPSKMSVGEDSNAAQNSASTSAPAVNSDSTHECGDGSSSGEGQDDSSNASTESDTTPAPTTPIRITIRSGSQVLAKVSSQRVSQDSNDSDDNKPLSIIRKEVRKARVSDEEVPNSTDLANVTPEKKGISDVGDTNNGAVEGGASEVSTNISRTVGVNNCVTSSTNSPSSENGDVSMADLSKIPESTATGTTITTNNSLGSSAVSSSGSVSNSAPSSSSEAEGESAMEANSGVEKASDKEVLGSDTQENKSVIDNDENSDGREDETDSGKEKTVLKNEKDLKGSKDKSKDKEKHRDSEKKDKREKEHDKDKKSKDDKKKEKDKDSKSSKNSSSSRSDKSSKSEKHRSSSSHSKSGKDKDRESSSKSRDRDRDRSKSSRDKDRKSSSSSSIKDKSRDKEREDKHDKKKEQENEDKATLEKVKPLSADGLAKIPRKTTPASFLDALGSADSDGQESKKPSVKTYKSRGFRNTGLLDEPTKPPGKKTQAGGPSDKKTTTATAGQGVKRPSPLDDLLASSSIPDKRLKSSVSSSPLTSDKPGGVKLISPKRPSLSDDGGFMAALTASGTDSRKKITRKRKSSESDSSSKQDGKEDDKRDEDKSPVSSPVKATEDKNVMLSPTSVKPTFNFYQETLKDDTDEEKKEGEEKETSEAKEEKEGSDNGEGSTEGTGGDVDMSSSASQGDNDSDNMDIDESEDQDDSVQIGLGESFGGGGAGVNGRSGDAGLRDEDIPIAPAVPAPAQEDYEKVEVTFSEPTPGVRGVLVYHRPEGRKKKAVKWKAEEALKEVFLFEMDETERVNVNTIKFNEMMVLEKQREREAMGKSRGFHGSMMGGNMNMMGGNNHMMGMGMHQGQNVIEYMRWSLLPIMIPSPKVTPGYKSQERVTQAARESSTMAAFYNPAMLPETPREPDPEMVSRTEPKEIPLNDVTGQDMLYDHRNKMWPEPLFMEPVNYGFGGMGGPSSGGNEGGSHWVVGGPPAGGFPPGPGGPMYGAPPGGFGGPGMGGPGMGGPPMGGPGMGGPPGAFGGDMGPGGMDVPGWGGPPAPGPPGAGPGMDYPNPNMMMGGGNQGMMMGGGGGGRPGNVPRGMMHNMGMGGQGFRGRNGPGGGNWGPGPGNYVKAVCKHFMNGHCRHGPKCRFLHTRH